MHTKIASLWRFIRTPVLLASTTVLLISCASKNPLIDEVEQPENKKSVVSAATDEKPVKTIEADKPVPKTKPAVTRTENEPVGENDNELNRQPEGMRKWISKLTPYKVDIQQGNFVSSEMLSKLKPGMTKEQVRFVLGTPLLTDMFHANRWDYLFRLQKPNGALTTNRVTVFFKDNLVDRIVHDNLPDEAQYLSNIAGDKVPTEKQKKSSTDEYKASEKKVPDVTETETETVPKSQKEAELSTAPDEPVSKPAPVKTAEPIEVVEPVKTVEPVKATVQAAEPAKTAEPVKIVEPVKTVEPVKAAEPVRMSEPVKVVEPVEIVEPVRVVEPVQTPASVNQPVPASIPAETANPSVTTSEPEPAPRMKRLERAKPVQADSTDDEASSSQNNIKTFEPISIPSRTGKMLPASPNDQLIGNIQ
ncbi:outer membrane protein assembly factor BamE [uncultured Oxalobacter sp.]|uniref:outer membrane protein assembly factor BamE n=1 Tax=uncultured Oxalobacter sp. TaxID=337245 RepID=UPI00338E6DBF